MRSIFGFFAAFAVLGAVAYYLRRRDDGRFNAASAALADEQARFWTRRLHADELLRAGDAAGAARQRELCAAQLVAVRSQVGALRSAFPEQSAEAVLFASYCDAGVREMARSLETDTVSGFDAAQLRTRLARGADAFRAPVDTTAARAGSLPAAAHLVLGALAGGVLGAGAAFWRRRWDASLLDTLPWFFLAGAVLGGVLAAIGRDRFWEKLQEWWSWA